jgi:hypothetical protein
MYELIGVVGVVGVYAVYFLFSHNLKPLIGVLGLMAMTVFLLMVMFGTSEMYLEHYSVENSTECFMPYKRIIKFDDMQYFATGYYKANN